VAQAAATQEQATAALAMSPWTTICSHNMIEAQSALHRQLQTAADAELAAAEAAAQHALFLLTMRRRRRRRVLRRKH
jgi:hypothetical protein